MLFAPVHFFDVGPSHVLRHQIRSSPGLASSGWPADAYSSGRLDRRRSHLSIRPLRSLAPADSKIVGGSHRSQADAWTAAVLIYEFDPRDL